MLEGTIMGMWQRRMIIAAQNTMDTNDDTNLVDVEPRWGTTSLKSVAVFVAPHPFSVYLWKEVRCLQITAVAKSRKGSLTKEQRGADRSSSCL